jgi:hypothetical protein
MLNSILNQLKKFREQIYASFSNRSDATMELLDALSGNQNARSIVQLSLEPAFRREYASINDAIAQFDKDPQQWDLIQRILMSHCDTPTKTRPYRLLALDCTSNTREHAKTLEDKGIVHKPNLTPGNKPITVGHQYSVVGFLHLEQKCVAGQVRFVAGSRQFRFRLRHAAFVPVEYLQWHGHSER